MKTTFIIIACIIITISSCTGSQELSKARLATEKNQYTGLTQGNLLSIDTFDLEIIPPSSGVMFYLDGIIFISSSKNDEQMPRDHMSFGIFKTYYAGIYEGTLFKYTDFSPTLPFDCPSDAVTFTGDYKTMFFTRISEKDGKEKIFHATRLAEGIQSGWSFDQSYLNFCRENTIYTHPTLSSDNQYMIFASDQEKPSGDLDLYISKRDGSGWSTAESLGSQINSAGNELYPFLDSDNNLFFSSDRAGGQGGYDLYFCRNNGKSWERPVLLSQRINSELDDIAFSVDKKGGKSAFLTRRVPGSSKAGQLYRITVNNNIAAARSKDLRSIIMGLTVPLSQYEATIRKPEEEVTPPDQAIQTATVRSAEISRPDTIPITETATSDRNKTEVIKESEIAKEEKPEIKNAEVIPAAGEEKRVVFRVQIITTSTSKGSYSIKVGDNSYNTWEYFYKGAWRTTIGEFTQLADASKLQSVCRKAGYKEAFVVAFLDNVRSTDPSLFK